jgi:hypothetical protein
MSAQVFNQISALLPQLSTKELQALRGLIAVRLESAAASPSWLIPAVLDLLIRSGLNPPPLSRVAPAVRKQATEVEVGLTRTLGALNRAETAALGRLAAEALADWAENHHPGGKAGMLICVGRVPEAIEAAFPGYLGSGLIHALLVSHG